MLLSLLLALPLTADVGVYFYRDTASRFASGQKSLAELERTRLRTQNSTSFLVEKDGRESWIEKTSLVFPDDLGTHPHQARLLVPSALKLQASYDSRTLLSLPELSDVWVVEYFEEFARVRFGDPLGVEGFLPLQHLVLKADFAAFVARQDGRWLPVKHRERNRLILQDGQALALQDIRHLVQKTQVARVIKGTSRLSSGNFVKVLRDNGEPWLVSQLPGHGEVYWRRPRVTSTDRWTTSELLKMEIYSVSFHPRNPKLGLVSADGVFLTQDGENWSKLSAFKNLNVPVLVTEAGKLFVGHQWSENLGQSFKPYLKFDQVAQSVREPLSSLKIESLVAVSAQNVQLQIHTGTRRLSLLGNPSTHSFILR